MEPYEFLLDLTPKGAPAVRVTCSQNDVKRPFVAHLKYLGKDFAVPDGSRAEIRVRKPDNNIYIGNCTCEQCYVYYQTALQMTCVAGECLSEISIINTDGNQIGTWNFIIYVEADPTSAAKKSESLISWIETAREEINNTAVYAAEAKQSSEEAKKSETNAKVSSDSARQSASSATTASQTAQTAAETASASANTATTKASEAQDSATAAGTSETNAKASENSAAASASTASSKASEAEASATAAGASEKNAAASAKAAQEAASSASGGSVTTFNGRNGVVVPQSGDYSASLISRGTSDVGTDLTKIETDLSSEVSRAKSAESSNTSAIANESTRAKAAEANLSSELNDQIYSIKNTGIYIRVKSGKNLGNGLTSQQAKKISDGDFYGLNIGDYWEANGNKFRIWHPNWYMNRGDQKFTKNHLVIMPDANILKADGSTTHYMNNTDTTSGGYAGTKYRSTYKSQCLKAFTDVFGTDHIAKYRGLLSNAVASGEASGWAWYDCDAELPSEEMMFGAHHWSTSTDSGSSGYNGGSFWGQLALAIIAPEFVVNGENYFEQDVATAAWFADVSSSGVANVVVASYPWVGGRPFALLI